MKVAAISAGHSPVVEPGLQPLLAKSVAAGTLHASVRPADALENADVSLLCVGTPSTHEWRGQSRLHLPRRRRPRPTALRVIPGTGMPHDRHPEHGSAGHRRRRHRSCAEFVRRRRTGRDRRRVPGVPPRRHGYRGLLVSALHGDRSVGSAGHRHRVATVRLPRRTAARRAPPHGRSSQVRVQRVPCHEGLVRQRTRTDLEPARCRQPRGHGDLLRGHRAQHLTQVPAAWLRLRRVVPAEGPSLTPVPGAGREHRRPVALRCPGEQPIDD